MAEYFKAATNCDPDVAKTSPVPLDTFEIRRQQFIHEKLVSQAVQTQLLLSKAEDADKQERAQHEIERQQNFHNPYSSDHAHAMRVNAEEDVKNSSPSSVLSPSKQISNLVRPPLVKDPLDRFPGIISTGGNIAPKYEPPAGSGYYLNQQLLTDLSLKSKVEKEKQKWKVDGDRDDNDVVILENDLSSLVLAKDNNNNNNSSGENGTRTAMLLDPSLRKKGPHALKKELEDRIRQIEIDSQRKMDDLTIQEENSRTLQEKRRQVEATRHARRAAVEATSAAAVNAAASSKSNNNNSSLDSHLQQPELVEDPNSAAATYKRRMELQNAATEQYDDIVLNPLSPGWGRRRAPHPVDVLHQRIRSEISRELEEFEHRQARTFMSTRLRGMVKNGDEEEK